MPNPSLRDTPTPSGSHWSRRLLLAAVVGFVVISRFAYLGARPFHHDESLFSYYAWQEADQRSYNAGGYDRHVPDGTPLVPPGPGQPTHHPLLHGPLQMELVGMTLWLADWLGVIGDGDAAARTVAALCAVALFFVLAGMARDLGGGPGLAMAALALAVSPEIWYYGRFCRNEPIFLLVTLGWVAALARVWRLPSVHGPDEEDVPTPTAPAQEASAPEARIPGPSVSAALPSAEFGPAGLGSWWIVLACVLSAILVALKENSLFLLFNAGTFWLLLLVFQQWGAPGQAGGARRLSLWRLAWHYRSAWMGGLALGWLLLEAVYTNGFAWQTSFVSMYTDILQYWTGQHSEHRLYGEFHYYLPIMALYEPVAVGVLLVAAARLFVPWRRPVAAALLLLAFVLGLWSAVIGVHYVERATWGISEGQVLRKLHMTSPGHLVLAFVLGWITLYGAWYCLRQGRRFRAWLVWWAGWGILQYGYAGEKVPWISVHMVLPGLLLAADLVGGIWSRARESGRRGARLAACAVGALWLVGCGWNLVQGWRVCFVHPTNPGERLIYNHTQPGVLALAREMRRMALEPAAKVGAGLPMLEGEAGWPLLWYMHGTDQDLGSGTRSRHGRPPTVGYVFADASAIPPRMDDVALLVCDENYLTDHPTLSFRFDFTSLPLRCAWVPEPLHLLTPLRGALGEKYHDLPIPEPLGEADKAFLESRRALYGLGAWRSLWRYVLDPERRPWGDPATTAIPLDVKVGRLREASPAAGADAPAGALAVPDLPEPPVLPDLTEQPGRPAAPPTATPAPSGQASRRNGT